MIREAIDRVIELARPVVTHVDGFDYWTSSHDRILPATPDPMNMFTLSAFAQYVNAKLEVLSAGQPFVHVASPQAVLFRTGVEDRLCVRRVWAGAMVREHECTAFDMGRWYGLEEFLIKLTAQFAEAGDKAKVIRMLGNVSEDEARVNEDDGITQKLTMKRGVAVRAEEEIANPMLLAPFRTFPDIEQPISPFILRVRGGGDKEVALFEADGGAWELAAIERIAAKLREALPSEMVILA